MYLFSFKKFAGQDRVFQTEMNIGKAGDLLQTDGDIFLNLGEDISFPELCRYKYPNLPAKIIYPGLFDQHFLSFLHRMTYEWYASYKSVIKYFISMEIQQFLLRESKVVLKKGEISSLKKSPSLRSSPFPAVLTGRSTKGGSKSQILQLGTHSLDPAGQNLIIFPDNRSRYNMLPDSRLDSPEIINLFSTDTQNKKDLNRRKIKQGAKGPIIATQSEVFQPYTNLKKILFVDPHKWYYNNQQDPRYSLSTVVQKMGEIYNAEIEEVSFQGSL